MEPVPGAGTEMNFIYHQRTILCHVISGSILVVFLLSCILVYRIVLCVCVCLVFVYLSPITYLDKCTAATSWTLVAA